MGLFKSKAERWFEEGKNLIYRQGEVNQGIVLLEQSAEREFAPAMLMLAELYHSGQVRDGGRYSREYKAKTCPKNEVRALELYQKLPDCLPVLARKAEIYCCGDGEVRDEAKALQMFQEIQSRAGEKENRKLFDLLGIMRLWRDDISGELLRLMQALTLRLCGSGGAAVWRKIQNRHIMLWSYMFVIMKKQMTQTEIFTSVMQPLDTAGRGRHF